MYIIIAFIVAIVLLIVSISKFKVHPFLALLGVSLLLAIAAGIPLKNIPDIIGSGFAGVFKNIGLVIIFGMLIGSLLESSGAAYRLAEMVQHTVGKRHPEIAMLIMGFIVSIPVFCDSGFVIMNPIRKAIGKKKGVSPVALSVALAAGLYCSHVFIPPTPGPIAAAGFLGVENHLLLLILLGTAISIPCLVAAYFYARYIGKRVHSSEETEKEDFVSSPLSEASLASEDSSNGSAADIRKLPEGFASLFPILLPIVLMSVGSVASLMLPAGCTLDVCTFLGKPVIALAAGFICAIAMLAKWLQKSTFRNVTENSLKSAGPILFITAAGGVLGTVISQSGLIGIITSHAQDISGLGILLPFAIAALLKTTQGSSTVAITTTAAIMGLFTDPSSMMTALGLTTPISAVLTVLAIGAGAMTVSHANDSYFWVVTTFSGLDAKSGYKTQTVSTLILGVTAIASICLLNMIL